MRARRSSFITRPVGAVVVIALGALSALGASCAWPGASAEQDAGSPASGPRLDEKDAGPGDEAPADPPDDPIVVADGATRYAALCASCHGAEAQGAAGPRLAGWAARGRTRDELVTIIDVRMPPGAEEACDGTCATAIAAFILSLPSPAGEGCEGVVALAPRQLRLLTRSELSRTLADLFQDVRPRCTTSADCIADEQSCGTDGRCHVDSCRTHTFRYDPAGRTVASVELASELSGWQPTPMSRGADGVWTLKRDLPDGAHAYKLVLDGSEWVADPTNPRTTPDGYGGVNSVVEVACAQAPPVVDEVFARDWARSFPVESRPQHYPFDNAAAAGLVSDRHVDEAMRAAAEIARLAVTDLAALSPCLGGASPDAACVTTFVRDFGARAFRRPLDDEEVARFTALAQAESTLVDGIGVALEVMLVSPQLLYRTELGAPDPADGAAFLLTPWETASALSYALTGSMPDDALFAAAQDGHLTTAADVEREARRLLATPAARARLEEVALQWLGIEALPLQPKSPQYADFTPAVRQGMLDESRRFFSFVVFEGSGRYDELITSEQTFLSPALAAFYGTAAGDQVTAPDARRGILGQGAVLATLAYPDQTSPPRRGVFVRERVLCQELGQVPANAGAIPDVDTSGTTRQRFEEHSRRADCRACHQYIDGVGFGFEHFDAVGRWRDTDNGQPVDARGELQSVEELGDGSAFSFQSVAELADLVAGSDQAAQCFATQMFRYSHGRAEDDHDRCALARLGERFRTGGEDIQTLLVDVLKDESFRRRR